MADSVIDADFLSEALPNLQDLSETYELSIFIKQRGDNISNANHGLV